MVKSATPKSIIAIKRAAILGSEIQRELGDDVRSAYIERNTLSEIAWRFDIASRYGVESNIAKTAVYYAIRGYSAKGGRVQSYKGLLSGEEADKIASENLARGRRLGSLRGSWKGGRITLERGVGIHSQTEEERREVGLRGLDSQGKVLWTKEEGRRVGELFSLGYDVEDIADLINKEYHSGREVRTSCAVNHVVKRIRREARDNQ